MKELSQKILLLDSSGTIPRTLLNLVAETEFDVVRIKNLDALLEALYTDKSRVAVIKADESTEQSHAIVKKIKESAPTVQVIVMVSNASTQDIINFVKEGAFDVITTDLSLEEMGKVISQAWESGRSVGEPEVLSI